MAKLRKLVAGNWKMNMLAADGTALAAAIAAQAREAGTPPCDLLLCPPATILRLIAETVGDTPVAVGGQDCHSAESGAYTGDISAAMLNDAGASHVILGHSERRHGLGETDATVKAKAAAALQTGLTVIICIGETEAERDGGKTLDVLSTQLAGSLPLGSTLDGSSLVIAYEPVWAIGTGRTPGEAEIAEAHTHMREVLTGYIGAVAADVRLLYGGSVKPDNAAAILALDHVDGALVGGASLDAANFMGIAQAAG